MTDRRLRAKWGIFPTMRGERYVQLDVIPALPNRRMVDGHTHGESCFCRPRREWHPQNIPLFVHERHVFNQKEDAQMNDPKYDPNKKADDASKDDENAAPKKKPDDEDEEEEETKKK